MRYTGDLMFTHFVGKPEQNLAPMTRAILEFSKDEVFAIFLNETDNGVIVAAQRVVSRENGKVVTNKTTIAQVVADEIEGIAGFEYAFTLQLPNGILFDDFTISEVRKSVKEDGRVSYYRQAQPLAIAKVRAKVVEAPAKVAAAGEDF